MQSFNVRGNKSQCVRDPEERVDLHVAVLPPSLPAPVTVVFGAFVAAPHTFLMATMLSAAARTAPVWCVLQTCK